MKVLFDSNIHISDAIFGGEAARAVAATLRARWKIFICQTILTEVVQIIRVKFHHSRGFTSATLRYMRDISAVAEEPISHHNVTGDPDDTPILRAAVAAGVDYVVTGDDLFLRLKIVEGVRIITLAEYLHILEEHGYK